MKEPRSLPRVLFLLALCASGGAAYAQAQTTTVHPPMVCSRGPGGQHFDATITMPRTAAAGSTITVRIDGVPAPPTSHLGLFHLYNFLTDFRVSEGGRLVEGSVRLVPDSGSPNMRPGARASREGASTVRLTVPAQIPNGHGFNPPSVEFSVALDGAPGAEVRVLFVRHQLGARVFLLGDIVTTCDPRPGPAVLGSVRITAP